MRIPQSLHKKIQILIIIMLFCLMHLPFFVQSAPIPQWNDDYKYQQQINIPIDTSIPLSIHQPIDKNIQFTNPCWGEDESKHSVRVVCYSKNRWYELESQIYDVVFDGSSVIKSCHIVFLIPEFADGTESYHVYYDDTEKTSPMYPDHVSISESYYRYEPISGYPLESSYYKISDDDSVPYVISQEGQFMGYNTGQHITKMLDNITEIHPKNGDLFAAFDFKYSYDNGLFDYSSTSQKLINKEIFIDGNLMLSFGMVSTSRREDLKTTVTYTYYHCPTSTTRIRTHVKHETNKDVVTLMEASTDGVYASLQSGGVKSNSIEDLNIGEILPYMHFKNEFNEISSYELDTDPEYIPDNPDIRIVSYKDDVDLGDQPWISFNQGTNGLAHAVLFHSNKVISSGKDERDGLQLNAFQMDYPHLPGLENNIATIQIGRNSYEPDDGHDIEIPADFVAEFNAEFFTIRSQGFQSISEEAALYNTLIADLTSTENQFNENNTDVSTYSLSVFVHHSPSFPFGSALSAATGLDLSYISAELYQHDQYLSSKTAVRIPMNALNQDANTMLTKLKAMVNIIDYRNISLMKQVEFIGLKPGTYTVKIFVENPFIGTDRKYIGFAIIEITNQDIKTHIWGKNQQNIEFFIVDQNNKPIDQAQISILKNSGIVTKAFPDESGNAVLIVPGGRKTYDVAIELYGLEVFTDTIQTTSLTPRIIQKEIMINLYDLIIDIKDQWGLAPGIQIDPLLISSDEISLGLAEKISDSTYHFLRLPPDLYRLILKYKSVTYEDHIDLTKDTTLSIDYPALFNVNITVFNNHGLVSYPVRFDIERQGKSQTYQSENGIIGIEVPPGIYDTTIFQNDKLIGKQTLVITGNTIKQYITNHTPLYPLIINSILFGCIGLLVYISYRKKIWLYIESLLPGILLLASITAPWWFIQGEKNGVETFTHLYLLPSKLITITQSSTFIVGDQGFLPDLFFTMIQGLIGLILLSAVFTILIMYLQNINKKFQLILHIITLICIISIIGIFIIGMSTLSEVSVGSFIGEGILDVSIGGPYDYEKIPCTWGPSIGFYLIIGSLLGCLYPYIKKHGLNLVYKK